MILMVTNSFFRQEDGRGAGAMMAPALCRIHGSWLMVQGSYAEDGLQQCWADDCGAGRKADGTMSVKYLEKIWWIQIFMLYLPTERDIDI